MDGRQFDDLVRDASHPATSRRGVVLGLAGAIALALGASVDMEAGKRRRRRRRNRRRNVTVCFKGRELVVDRVAARELVSRGAQLGACRGADTPGEPICPIGTVPCTFASAGSDPACCGPNSICATCNPGGDCVCCPAVGGSCPSCQAPSFVCCSTSGNCSCCASNQGCDANTGECADGSSPADA